jgi:2-oxoglutarate dehydrogenase E1 component
VTGQDVVRGTFSQRHAAYIDTQTNRHYIPLQHLPMAQASFEIHNSPLTESAALAFEFGYNTAAGDRLVVWEAQYGDFINVAQAIVDEFVVSARAKWGQLPSLVLLLPHGNEGQGPDHASARLERFLQAAAENNLRIAYPTTAAQYFHLLRRQAALLSKDPLPLIVLTPKGLLRHPMTASRPEELAEGSWQPVLDDDRVASGVRKAGHIRRLALCTGRVFTDLAGSERRQEKDGLAIARVEQLYPFPQEPLSELVERYPALEQVAWVQEEPANMGAWGFYQPRLVELAGGRWPVQYIGRPASSSPAEGSATWYAINQRALVEQVFQEDWGIGARAIEGSREAQKERG